MRVYRQSAIKEWKTCKRQAMLDYFMDGNGYETAPDPSAPAESGGRGLGTLVHLGVEAYYKGEDAIDIVVAEERAATEAAGKFGLEPTRAKEFKLAKVMLEGYVEWVASEGCDIGEETVETELQLEFEVGTIRGENVMVTGKLDRLVLDTITNEYIIEDTKTVQAFEDLRWLAMGDQLLTYNVLLRAGAYKGEPLAIHRGRHNQLRKVARGPQSKPPFYSRVEFPFNDTQVKNHWTHLMATLDEMVQASQAIEADPEAHHQYAYPNPTKDCTWRCDFLSICPMMDDGGYWRNSLGDLYVPRGKKESNA